MTDPANIETSATLARTFPFGGQDQEVRLGADAWAAFDEYCGREAITAEELCVRAALRLGEDALEDKILGLLTGYFKDAADCDPEPASGLSEDDGPAPPLSPALRAALDAIGKS